VEHLRGAPPPVQIISGVHASTLKPPATSAGSMASATGCACGRATAAWSSWIEKSSAVHGEAAG
jgi:hypothetical protein